MAATLSTSIARGPLSLRSLFAAPSSLRSTFSSPLAWASSSSAPSTSNSYIAASGSAAALSPFAEPRSLLGGLLEQLLELFPSILLAVPKKQTTHRRKRMRQNGKGPKDKQNIDHCKACGRAKLMHNICAHCYSQITRDLKNERRVIADLEARQQQVVSGEDSARPAVEAAPMVAPGSNA